ncbi:MAG: hypothetical protein HFH03_04000 [Dorea sp.]|nr:hypothetical protein [Dorea sp.]
MVKNDVTRHSICVLGNGSVLYLAFTISRDSSYICDSLVSSNGDSAMDTSMVFWTIYSNRTMVSISDDKIISSVARYM